MGRNEHGRRRGGPWQPSPEQLALYEAVIRGDQSLRAIAKQFGFTPSTVSEVCSRVDKWLIPQYMDRIREIRANHSSRIMSIHRQSLAEWHKSQKPKATRRKTPTKDGKTVVADTIEMRTGDPRYLSIAIECLEHVRKIWGMNEPEKIVAESDLRVAGMPRATAILKRKQQLEESLSDAIKHGKVPAES